MSSPLRCDLSIRLLQPTCQQSVQLSGINGLHLAADGARENPFRCVKLPECPDFSTGVGGGATQGFTMALELVRGLSPTLAGVGVSAGSIGWTSGSWMAVAFDRRFGVMARSRAVRIGLTLVILGTGGTVGTLVHGFPIEIAMASWGLAGLGMGIAYNTDSVLAIQAETEHSAATVSSSMQLTDSLGQVLGTGMGGVVLAIATAARWGTSIGIAITFGLTIAVSVIGILLAPRMTAPAIEPGLASRSGSALGQ
jgi:hypothetical protein